jgi:hypothetical protein
MSGKQMIPRPPRVEQKSSREASDLDRGLAEAIEKSILSVREKLGKLLETNEKK